MPLPDYLIAAMELAGEADRDEAGNLTPEGKAQVQAALDHGKEEPQPVREAREQVTTPRDGPPIHVTINMPPPPAVTLEAPITVNVPEQKPPQVKVDVAPAEVTVNMPEQKPRSRKLEHDKDGNIVRIVEE